MQRSAKIAKWERWLATIRRQMYEAMGSRLMYNEMAAVLRANPTLSRSAFWDALPTWYASSALMAIRRQIKVDNQGISLAGLLADIAANAAEVSREYWIGLYAGLPIEEEAAQHFEAVFGTGAPHLDPATPADDGRLLKETVRACEQYADKRVAHFDKGAEPKAPTFAELDGALDLIDRLIVKYTLFVSADSLEGCTPHIQRGWDRVFDMPWRVAPPT